MRLVGQQMDLVKPEEVLHFITGAVEQGKRAIVANHNAHSLYLLRQNERLQRFYEQADLVEIDSVPLLLWARLSGRKNSRRFHRCTYLDWRTNFWTLAAARQWRVFYLGAAPGVAGCAAERLEREFPGAVIGVRDGFFDASPGCSGNVEVLQTIASFRPQVLMVGMGMPRQEEWIAQNYDALDGCVVLPVGAAFDYEAGVQRPAPRWVGRVGLEWLFRLSSNPSRMFRRYCLEPWALLTLLARDWGEARRHRRLASRTERRSGAVSDAEKGGRRASDLRGSVTSTAYPELPVGTAPATPSDPRPSATVGGPPQV